MNSGSVDKTVPGSLFCNLNDDPTNSNGHANIAGSNRDYGSSSAQSGGLNSPIRLSNGNLDHVNSILNNDNIGFASFMTNRITLANLLSNSDDVNRLNDIGSSCSIAWSNGTDSHDSGIGDSPPFDNTKR